MPKLLETTVSKIVVPSGKRDVLVFDDSLPGFGVRKFETGRASYFVKYSIGRQQRKITLGPVVPGVLAEMRRKASDILARARLGDDVRAVQKVAVDRKAATVRDLIDRYLKSRNGDMRPRYRLEVERHLLRQWEPLHRLTIEEVTRRTLVERIDELADESGRTAADRAKSSMGAFLAWCVERSFIELNPCVGIRRRVTNGMRDRVLSLTELVSVWRASHDDDYGRIIRLLILTMQRKTEIGDLGWSEIDFDRRQIELPGTRTKNKRTHIVPLADPAIAILQSIQRRAGRDFVFGGGEGGFSGWSKAKAALDSRLPGEIAPWRIHDIRRSVITHLNELSIAQPHIVEAIANHISGHKAGVAGIYNRSVYADEKRKALHAWAETLFVKLQNDGDGNG
jgi:integrase